MTFQQYIANPTGMGTAVMSYRKMYEDLYQNKFKVIMTREAGKINYTLWKHKDQYCYCFIKIPSEVVPNFYYDVIIRFKVNKTSMSLSQSEVSFFSNDPSFSYTFAYAFKKHSMTIPELEFKMSKRALNNRAVEKNPQAIINYVKSLYFAYIVMREKGLFQRALYMDAPEFDHKKFDKLVEHTDIKVQDRQNKGEEIEKEKRRKANQAKASSSKPLIRSTEKDNPYIKTVGTIRNVGSKYPINKPLNNSQVKNGVRKTPNKNIIKNNSIGRKKR